MPVARRCRRPKQHKDDQSLLCPRQLPKNFRTVRYRFRLVQPRYRGSLSWVCRGLPVAELCATNRCRSRAPTDVDARQAKRNRALRVHRECAVFLAFLLLMQARFGVRSSAYCDLYHQQAHLILLNPLASRYFLTHFVANVAFNINAKLLIPLIFLF